MGIAVPAALFLLLDLQRPAQFFAIAAITFCSWGIADVLATILSRPRLQNRSPGHAFREDWERRSKE